MIKLVWIMPWFFLVKWYAKLGWNYTVAEVIVIFLINVTSQEPQTYSNFCFFSFELEIKENFKHTTYIVFGCSFSWNFLTKSWSAVLKILWNSIRSVCVPFKQPMWKYSIRKQVIFSKFVDLWYLQEILSVLNEKMLVGMENWKKI